MYIVVPDGRNKNKTLNVSLIYIFSVFEQQITKLIKIDTFFNNYFHNV